MSQADVSQADVSRLAVLIVDDEQPIAEVLAQAVEDAGFVALVALHGKAGLTLARQHHPAFIISDVMMPLMGGPEFIQTLIAELDGNMPPFVFMTAGNTRHLQDIGAVAVLQKPFDLAEIEALLQRLLENR